MLNFWSVTIGSISGSISIHSCYFYLDVKLCLGLDFNIQSLEISFSQSRGIMGGEVGASHRTSRDLYMTEYQEQRTPSSRHQRSRTQV